MNSPSVTARCSAIETAPDSMLIIMNIIMHNVSGFKNKTKAQKKPKSKPKRQWSLGVEPG